VLEPVNKTRLLTVLSAPRSGSSALCRLLSALGLNFGERDRLLEANRFNKYGYFERPEILAINDEVIRKSRPSATEALLWNLEIGEQELDSLLINAFWSTCHQPLSADSPHLLNVVENAIKNFQWISDAKRNLAWKDARFCMTWNVWQSVVDMLPIIIWRDPAESAKSIERTMGIPFEISQWLWLYYTRAAFLVTEGQEKLILSQAEMIATPVNTADKICQFLVSNGYDINSDYKSAAKVIDNSAITSAHNPESMASQVMEFHGWLQSGASGSPPIAPEPDYPEDWVPLITVINRYKKRSSQLREKLRTANHKLDRIRKIPGYTFIGKMLCIYFKLSRKVGI